MNNLENILSEVQTIGSLIEDITQEDCSNYLVISVISMQYLMFKDNEEEFKAYCVNNKDYLSLAARLFNSEYQEDLTKFLNDNQKQFDSLVANFTYRLAQLAFFVEYEVVSFDGDKDLVPNFISMVEAYFKANLSDEGKLATERLNQSYQKNYHAIVLQFEQQSKC